MLTTLHLALAFVPLASTAPDDPSDVLRVAERAFCQATRERGREGWLEWFAEDAVVFPPRGPLAVGAAAVRRHYEGQEGFPAAGFLWEPEEAGLAGSGDLGWTRGRWGNNASGQPVWAGQYLSVWQKQADGTWKVVADCTFAPDFATRVSGLTGAPHSSGSETEQAFTSAAGDLVATAGSWWVADETGVEVGGKLLTVWRRGADGVQERLLTTGLVQVER
jgi:ketosteroid isomerase-like protein